MDNRPIGVFDSGIGGLTVVKELMNELPNEKIIYLGDTARVPYGNRDEDTIRQFSKECVNFLEKQNIKIIVIACNTVSAIALDVLKENVKVDLLGVIEAGSYVANRITKNRKIAVIGTNATIKNAEYERRLKKENPNNTIFSKACPLFVPIIEEGLSDTIVAYESAKYYLEEFIKHETDTLILGCTHYPLLENTIKNVLGDKIQLVNPAKETAINVKKLLEEKNKLSCDKSEYTFYVTGRENKFKENLNYILDIDKIKLKKVNINHDKQEGV